MRKSTTRAAAVACWAVVVVGSSLLSSCGGGNGGGSGKRYSVQLKYDYDTNYYAPVNCPNIRWEDINDLEINFQTDGDEVHPIESSETVTIDGGKGSGDYLNFVLTGTTAWVFASPADSFQWSDFEVNYVSAPDCYTQHAESRSRIGVKVTLNQ